MQSLGGALQKRVLKNAFAGVSFLIKLQGGGLQLY